MMHWTCVLLSQLKLESSFWRVLSLPSETVPNSVPLLSSPPFEKQKCHHLQPYWIEMFLRGWRIGTNPWTGHWIWTKLLSCESFLYIVTIPIGNVQRTYHSSAWSLWVHMSRSHLPFPFFEEINIQLWQVRVLQRNMCRRSCSGDIDYGTYRLSVARAAATLAMLPKMNKHGCWCCWRQWPRVLYSMRSIVAAMACTRL